MIDIQACGEILNIRHLDCAVVNDSGIFFLVGHAAQQSSLRMLIESLRYDYHRYLYAVPFVVDPVLPKGILEVWSFGLDRDARHKATIHGLAIPFGFEDRQ